MNEITTASSTRHKRTKRFVTTHIINATPRASLRGFRVQGSGFRVHFFGLLWCVLHPRPMALFHPMSMSRESGPAVRLQKVARIRKGKQEFLVKWKEEITLQKEITR
jgi:hypothetical protein